MTKNLKNPPRFSKASPIGAFVKNIVQPICQRQGFVSAAIILDWEKIVGPHFAKLCRPQKIAFPYKMKKGGCLHVVASSAMALAIAYEKNLILEKVNQFYGYIAITELRIHHESLDKKVSPSPSLKPHAPLKNVRVDIDYEPLKKALEKLGQALPETPL